MHWLRQPALHFGLIGALLYGLEGALVAFAGAPEPSPEPLVVGAERVARVRDEWRMRTGRPPEPSELEALLEAEIDEELLIREARRLGFHRVDPVVRQRLVRNMRFLSEESEASEGADGEASAADDDALLAEAFALGMDRTDVVVRRRLVQLMQLQYRELARAAEPDDAELARHLARHAERYRRPARARISHVYLSRDRRGAALPADARALGRRLVDGGLSPERAADLGDPFLFPHQLPLRSERELAKTFGPDFARRALELSTGAWAGPVASSYGLHWVFVHERREAAPASFESVRRELREAVLEERARALLREATRQLRARFPVRRGEDAHS